MLTESLTNEDEVLTESLTNGDEVFTEMAEGAHEQTDAPKVR